MDFQQRVGSKYVENWVSTLARALLKRVLLLRRFLQRKFDEAGPAAVALVLPEVLQKLIELMMDPFGNYLVQKLLDRCNEDQRLEVHFPTAAPSDSSAAAERFSWGFTRFIVHRFCIRLLRVLTCVCSF